MATKGGLLSRLENDGNVLIAEGFMWELERKGFVRFGDYTPEVVLENPEIVEMMHREFAHAGSDVCEAYTYLGSRAKLRQLGKEVDSEELNRKSLKMARKVADETGSLMAGDICHTWVYKSGEDNVEVKDMFKEQVKWAVEEGADYIIGETFGDCGEAMLALEAIKEYGNDLFHSLIKLKNVAAVTCAAGDVYTSGALGLTFSIFGGIPAVITLTAYFPDITMDGIPIPEACKRLEDAGAAVVGLNCARGPKTMLPLIKEIRKICKGPIAALPVPFRCNENYKTFQSLCHPETGDPVYPDDLCCMMCSRKEIRQCAEEFKACGVQYFGVCCGNSPAYMREVAEVFGRRPEASNFSADMSKSMLRSNDTFYDKVRKWALGEK